MKITDVKTEKYRLNLVKPFRIALGVIEYVDAVIVKIETDEGYYGVGECSPFAFVTGEDLDTAIHVIDILGKKIIGQNPMEIAKIHRIMDGVITRNTAAKASIDIALYDIIGKIMKEPLYSILGGSSNEIITDFSLSIDTPESMAIEAKEKAERGFSILKIKCGLNPKQDVEAIKQIRMAVGDRVELRVDANQMWNTNDAVVAANEMYKFGVSEIEQPLAAWNFEELAYVRSKIPQSIMLDESVMYPHEAIRAVKCQSADLFNLKLMKSGGIYVCNQINAIAEAMNMNCILGCYTEGIVGITAAAHFAAAKANILNADLDSMLYFKCPDFIHGGVTVEGEKMTLSPLPGLGITVDF